MFEKADAPSLIGQSNAHGLGTRLNPEEEINTPLAHVSGLSREDNQSYSLTDQDKGIFQEDLVHYNSQTQRWFAWWQWERLIQGKWVSG